MELETDKQMHKKIAELVHDEETIITCSSLARDLKLTLEGAKTLLQSYILEAPVMEEELLVTYILCGTLKEGKGYGVHLVKQDRLKEEKLLFDEISSEFVYSVQKNKPINFHLIAEVNSTCNTWQGIIISHNSLKRRKNISSSNRNNATQVSSSRQDIKHVETCPPKEDPISQQKLKPKHNGGIANLFSKMGTNKNASNLKSTVEIKSSSTSTDSDTTPAATQSNGSNISDKVIKEKVVNLEKEEKKIKENNGDSVAKMEKKKRRKNVKSTQASKKHKRIQNVDDSDSSDIFDEQEGSDVIDKSDEEIETPYIPKAVNHQKNKKRKAVDKTYMDDEGFVVTTTEYIYESASEEENIKIQNSEPKQKEVEVVEKNANKTKQNNKKGADVKSNAAKKQAGGKQSSIMNFFKKT